MTHRRKDLGHQQPCYCRNSPRIIRPQQQGSSRCRQWLWLSWCILHDVSIPITCHKAVVTCHPYRLCWFSAARCHFLIANSLNHFTSTAVAATLLSNNLKNISMQTCNFENIQLIRSLLLLLRDQSFLCKGVSANRISHISRHICDTMYQLQKYT